MKATVQELTTGAAVEKSRVAVFCELIKARLTFLVLLTTLVGFYVGSAGAINVPLMLYALAGTGLLACGAAALNQLLERQYDAKMRRTEDRPLPSGRLQPEMALIFGGVCSIAGLVLLAWAVNLLTSFLGALTLISYLFIYTPLKRVTWLNTAIGAVPGALPPLMGWTAARGELSGEGWGLFAILFFWQIPHFLAIAWLYRDEYAKAGFVMLPVIDRDGFRTGRQAVSHTLGLMLASLMPAFFGLAGMIYFAGALLLGSIFLGFALLFARTLTIERARQLFFVSITYLPLLLGLMVLDKVR
ncbi:MAG TPA: heme o synthase [Verrucomicrobiae bacterium]|nr:heme o synthase [Verrucomicrobiae bacterium]